VNIPSLSDATNGAPTDVEGGLLAKSPFALNFTLAAVEPGALSFWMDSGVGPPLWLASRNLILQLLAPEM
jgi:hypothetical protein